MKAFLANASLTPRASTSQQVNAQIDPTARLGAPSSANWASGSNNARPSPSLDAAVSFLPSLNIDLRSGDIGAGVQIRKCCSGVHEFASAAFLICVHGVDLRIRAAFAGIGRRARTGDRECRERLGGVRISTRDARAAVSGHVANHNRVASDAPTRLQANAPRRFVATTDGLELDARAVSRGSFLRQTRCKPVNWRSSRNRASPSTSTPSPTLSSWWVRRSSTRMTWCSATTRFIRVPPALRKGEALIQQIGSRRRAEGRLG